LASSWSKTLFASLSAAPVEPAIAFVVVDGLAPRGAIVESFVDDFSSDPVVVDVAPLEGVVLVDAPLEGVVLVDAPLEGVVLVDAPLEGVVLVDAPFAGFAGGVSAALVKAPAMPIVDTISPETSLLLSRRIIARSFGEAAALGCRTAIADARTLPASSH
jgi:hypothetical protein